MDISPLYEEWKKWFRYKSIDYKDISLASIKYYFSQL